MQIHRQHDMRHTTAWLVIVSYRLLQGMLLLAPPHHRPLVTPIPPVLTKTSTNQTALPVSRVLHARQLALRGSLGVIGRGCMPISTSSGGIVLV